MKNLRIVFLKPKQFTRFRIRDGFYSDETLFFIPSDTIYSLYLSKLLETDKKFKELNEKRDVEKIKEIVKNVPKISSAYPYIYDYKNKEITFYLPLPIDLRFMKNKRIRKKMRSYNTFIPSKILENLLDENINIEKNINILDEINLKVETITRNTINRISSLTVEGNLFSEKYIILYNNDQKEIGYYFLIEENEKTTEFLSNIKDFFEIRGIGSDKSVSRSVFNIKFNIDDLADTEINQLIEIVEKMRRNNYLLHSLILNEQTKDKVEYAKIRFLVIDGFSVYPIISDGSKLREYIDEPIVIPIRRRKSKKLSVRVFYGL